MQSEIPRLLVAGTASGTGKTSLTCGLLLAFKRRGLNPAAFKCGPDYIDPLFHSQALGVKSRNLDIFLCGEERVRQLLAENASGHGLALVEGVMGLYDGQGMGDYGSSNHLALATATPTVLVVNPRGQGMSLAAQVHGYLSFQPNNILGVILNQVSAKMFDYYRDLIAPRFGIEVFGYLPPLPEAVFKSRHLGLITPEESSETERKLNLLADECERCIDLDSLIEMAGGAPELQYAPCEPERVELAGGLRIGVARDRAFCFHYQDNYELLRRMGAEIQFFSPLDEPYIPLDIHGLILGGGYPEEYAAELAANQSMLGSVRHAGRSGLPIFAECGGFLYLGKTLAGRNGKEHQMCGLLDASAKMAASLGNFGYVTLHAEQDNFLCPAGTELKAHEFHYSRSSDVGAAFTARKAGGRSWPAIHASRAEGDARIFAGYPHFHLWGVPELAGSFLKACAVYAEARRG